MTNTAELNFKVVLRQALHHPEQVDFNCLFQALEGYLKQKTQHERLSIAGTAFVQLAELYELRAERLLNSWEENHSDTDKEPVITDDMLVSFLRQSMSLDIEDILESTHYAQRLSAPSGDRQVESVVGAVNKSDLLNVLDDIEIQQQALHIAHDERVSAWAEAIHQWMITHQRSVSLRELAEALRCHDSTLTLVKIWLGLLCGGYELEQRGEFYEVEGIWISLSQ